MVLEIKFSSNMQDNPVFSGPTFSAITSLFMDRLQSDAVSSPCETASQLMKRWRQMSMAAYATGRDIINFLITVYLKRPLVDKVLRFNPSCYLL
jgi:hypothetical protein